jgi:hypothetical protein
MRARVTFGLASLLALSAGSAVATVMMPMSLEEMSVEAKLVVTGKVLSAQSAWDESHRRIFTYTEIQVVEKIAGDAEPRTLVIRTMGGEVGDIGMNVSGTPRFATNEEVLVFLRQDPVEAQSYQVIGMSQGKFKVVRPEKGPVEVVPSTAGLAFVKRDQGGSYKVDETISPESKMTLDALKQRVVSARRAPTAPTISVPQAAPSGATTVPN